MKNFLKKRFIPTLAILCVCALAVIAIVLGKESHLDRIQTEMLNELDSRNGEYDTQKIVLHDTSKQKAETLAEKFDAKLRITSDGKFATLTLPDGVTIRDIFADDNNRRVLEQLAPDYMAKISDIEEIEEYVRPSVMPNYEVSDPNYSFQNYLGYINIGDAWSRGYKGAGTTVAVIDTGIDTDHPEFSGRISEWSYNATEDKIVKDYNDWSLIEDEQGHGTMVTGVIAAAMDGVGIVGISPEVNIIVIKAECDSNGHFYRTSDLVFGLYYAIERDVDVVNMSFGGEGGIEDWDAAVRLATDSDILMVAAAGNDSTATLHYPAAHDMVIGVGALEYDGWKLADYSNYGGNVDIVAPGTSVHTTQVGGKYNCANGTSLSSPIVAAALALIKGTMKYAENTEITEILYASCYDLGDIGYDWYYGYGALDVNALLCEERGTVTFNMLTDELENTTQVFIREHTLQNIPEPERLYAVFDGWYYDIECTEAYNWYADTFHTDLTLYANWVNEDDGVPYTYVILSDGTVEIRSYTGHRSYITIPDKIEGREVSSIGESAFEKQHGLRQVKLPKYLKKIQRNAFAGCSNLISMQIPDTVTIIGEKAFYDNVRLSSVSFGKDSELAEVRGFAFGNCGKLSTIDLPSKLAYIDGSAFFGATAMTSINVAGNNRNFVSSGGVLFNKTKSTLIAYPAGITNAYELPDITRKIDSYAFSYTRLTEIDLKNVTSIGEDAFAYGKISGIVIPDSVTTMKKGAFRNSMISYVSIGGGLDNIPSSAFSYCSYLGKVEIPENIREIGEKAFEKTSLCEVRFSENGRLLSIGKNSFDSCLIEILNFPDSLIKIEDEAFSRNLNLTTVTWGEESSLQSIGKNAFSRTVSLQSVAFTKNLRSIGENAFSGTALIQTVKFGENLQSIGGYAFSGSGIENSVVIPASVTDFGEGAFAYCYHLSEIKVDARNSTYVDYDGVVYTRGGDVIVEYPVGKTLTEYTVRDGVTTVGKSAFEGSETLTYVGLPEGITVLGERAFYACTKIASYTLPESLENIEPYALSFNYSLSFISIPDNVVQIGRFAFGGDMNLASIYISDTSKMARIGFATFANIGVRAFRVPRNVSSVAQYAFVGCKNLSDVTFAANSRLESISAYFFEGCDSIQNITFENGSALKSIQAHGLEGMKELRNIDFGDAKLENIDNYAFRYCQNLNELDIPNTLTNIGRFAFYKCTSLSSLAVPETLEHIGKYAFYGTNNCNLYFASETLPLYLDENWDVDLYGYYTGVREVVEDGDWKYAKQTNGKIAIIEYFGNEKNIDLTELSYGEIENIGGYVFFFKDIESIIMPDTVKQIQRYAFAENRNLHSVIIPASTEYIAQYAFSNTGIEELTFAGDCVKVIEKYAFSYTKSLKGVTLPSLLEKMGSYAFYHSGIETLTFSADSVISEIPQAAFAGTNLVYVRIPDSVTLINQNAFRECHSLKNVTFGSGKDLRIMSNVFYNTGLEQVSIPENVEYIGEFAFVGLRGLTAFDVSENNVNYAAIDGVLCNKSGTKIIAFPAGRKGHFVVNKNVEVIGFGAFENSMLSSVTFEEGINLLTIGYRAFFGAENLTEITIPSSVVSIDYYAFARCANLTDIIFAEDNRISGIYEGAFYGCIRLHNIVLPDSIMEISDYTFYGCTALKTLPISETSEIKAIYSYAMAYTGLRGEFVIPVTLIDIGDYAFQGTSLTGVIIPDDNAWDLLIGIGAFADCENIEEITVPFIGASFENTNITWFGYVFGAGSYRANAAYVPDSLKKVHISDGISFVGNGAFYGLETIEEIDVPASVSLLDYDSFVGTKARYTLKNKISIKNNVIPISFYNTSCSFFGEGIIGDVVFAEGLTDIGAWAFYGCNSLTNIVLPDGVTSIESRAFEGCSALTSVVIPDSVTLIADEAFQGCSSLMSVVLNDGVTDIGRGAFQGCSSLRSIVIPASVTSIRDTAFYDCINLNDVYISDIAKWCEISFGDYKAHPLTYAKNLYLNGSLVTELVIPDSVTNIGDKAFFGCNSLTSVVIPDSVTSIGEYAFSGCNSLANIVIPDSVTSIGGRAFYECGSLTSIAIPKNVTSIEYGTFGFCRSLTSIVIPDGVNSIGGSAFQGCSGLMSIVIPDGVTSIEYGTFEGCSSLKSIVIPDSVTSIDGHAFWGCSSLTNIVIPNGMTSIEDETFSHCKSLTNIVIPDSVTSIGAWAFQGCSGLTSIVIPENVTSIGDRAFGECYDLCCVYNNSNIPLTLGSDDNGCVAYYANIIVSADGSVQYRDGNDETYVITDDKFMFRIRNGQYTLISYFGTEETVTLPRDIGGNSYDIYSMGGVRNVIIPDGMTSITWGAFSECSSLTSIVIPDSVTSIGSSAFSGCSSLTSIVIPDSVMSIGNSAFSECSSLTSIVIPDSVTNIGESSFSGCNNVVFELSGSNTNFIFENGILWSKDYSRIHYISSDVTSVEIPDGVTSIGAGMFSDCSNLTSIVIPDSVIYIWDSAFSGCSGLTSVAIPDGVLSIGNSAFSGCSSLTSIVIPNGVTYIGYDAFRDCNSLTSIIIPDGVTSIRPGLFSGCNSLTSIVIPNGVTSIGYEAFSGCSSITSIVIPDSVTSIDRSAFWGCSSLRNIVIPDGVTSIGVGAFGGCRGLTSIVIPNSVTNIEWSAFSGCQSLSSIAIPDGVTSIEYGTFEGCSSLTSILIPDSVTSIGGRAFQGCSSLTSIVIPDGVTSIGYDAFHDCSSLTSIAIPASVTSIESSAFSGCNSLNAVYISDIAKWCGISFGNSNANPLIYAKNLYLNGNLVTELVIPDGMTSIGYGIFAGCQSLTSIEIPDSVTSIGDGAFSGCIGLTSIEIPNSVTSIGSEAFYRCAGLTNITIPYSVTTIGDMAFKECYGLYCIYNNSNIPLTFGSDDNGFLAKYAKMIVSADGLIQYRSENGGTYIMTDDKFLFGIWNGRYTLIAYLGTEETVTLPIDIDGNSYDIFMLKGLKNVIIPDGMTSIISESFHGCSSLKSIVIPDSVTSIGSDAFQGCSSLKNIVIPDSVTYIGAGAFYDTAYYDDPGNWLGGCLYIGNHLIKVKEDVEFIGREDIICVADSAYYGCYKLKKAIDGLGGTTNVETLVITKSSLAYSVLHPFEGRPMTLKTVILKKGVEVESSDLFAGITGIKIYVEDEKIDCPWIYVCPDWNNGNKVYYGGEWSNATFRSDGEILSGDVYLSSQVVRPPYVSGKKTKDTEKIFIGWDFDSDGKVDSLPATLIDNLIADAVFETKEATYHIEFVDKDGKTVLASYELPYGTIIPCPENPEKTGYSFVGWNGYYNGIKATCDMVITSKWNHNGDGHIYTETIVYPTCTEKGYVLHVCTVCGEAYKDNFLPATGHIFGDWIIDKEATCLTNGVRHRECACGKIEDEVISAFGHDYCVTHSVEATCKQQGKITYECRICHDVMHEETEISAHDYHKKYVSKSWIERLIDWILNIFWGYEGNKAYYYECSACGHIATQSEASSIENSSVQSTCVHNLGDWELLLDATTEVGKVEVRKCTKCGNVIEARINGEPLSYIIGDFDENEKVNSADVIYLLWHTFLPDRYPVVQNADFNNDGKINSADVIYLLWHTFLPDKYPLN